MKKIFISMIAMFFVLFQGINLNAQDIMITGVADGPLTGGLPKVLELYAVNDIADLSVYTVKNQTNANTTWSTGLPLSGSATAGDFIYIVYVDGDMSNFNGFFENTLTATENSVINLNGDDRVGLFNSSDELIDILGADGVDGTDTDWEWKDGWAYRNDDATASSTFSTSDWSFSGVDGLEGGSTNATCTSPFPIGTFGTSTDPSIVITSPASAATVYTDAVDVAFTVSNFTVGTDGKVAYAIDGGAVAYQTTTDNISFTSLSEDSHTVTLELVDMSDASLDPAVTTSVTFTVDLTPDPVLTITAPTEGATVTSADVDIAFNVQNFNVADGTGDGHIVYTVDGGTATNHVTTDAITLTGLTDASHTVALELVDNSGTSLDPAVTASVNFTVNTAGPSITAIYDIQYTTDASGDSPMVDQEVTVKGLVTAVDGDKFWMKDADAAWSGIYVYYTTTPGPALGDTVTVTGTVAEYYNATQIGSVSAMTVINSSNTVTPVVVTTAQANEEAYESVLVQVEGTNTAAPDSYGQWPVNDGSGAILIDDVLYAYTPTTGNDYRVTGIATYSYSERKVYPRAAADVVDLGVSTNPSISITSPAAGATIYTNAIDVAFTVSNFVVGTDGKVAYAIDGGTVAYQTSTSDITFTGLTEGSHTVNLELVDMSDASLDPAVTASVTFTVNLAGPSITPIYDIQYATDGVSPLSGQVVTIKGVVTADFNGSDYGTGYYVQDAAGAWNSLYVYDDTNEPSVGDSVQVTGEISEYFEMTEMTDVSAFTVVSIGGTVADPIVVTTAAAASEEQYESCLVKVENAECTAEQDGYGQWTVDDGSGDVTCKDNGVFDFTEVLGTVYNITGVINYSYGNYTLQYRMSSDVEVVDAVNDAFAFETEVYPNPAVNSVYMTNLNDVERVELISLMGQTLISEKVTGNTMKMNVESLASGVYMLKLISGTDSRIIRIEKN